MRGCPPQCAHDCVARGVGFLLALQKTLLIALGNYPPAQDLIREAPKFMDFRRQQEDKA